MIYVAELSIEMELKQYEDDLDCIQLKNFYKTNYWEIKILKEKRKGKSFIY